ncbi:MAG: hypothetical protein ORN29_09100 [Rhodoferax sp.]|nr:hypothetical protein [Rhodoferax sp.]
MLYAFGSIHICAQKAMNSLVNALDGGGKFRFKHGMTKFALFLSEAGLQVPRTLPVAQGTAKRHGRGWPFLVTFFGFAKK